MRSAQLSLAILTTLAISACQQLPTVPGREVTVLEVGALEQLNPNDIVVAPIEYAEEGVTSPERALRTAFVRGLVKRRYAPLSLDYVDERVTEASFPRSAVQADAVAQIIVRDWDQSLWEVRRALIVDLELRMLDPADPLGTSLWAGNLSKRFDFADREIEFAAEVDLFQAALNEIASDLLSVMPARRTEPGFE